MPYTLDDAKRLASKNGGKCMSKHYVAPPGKMLWKCSNKNHEPWLSDIRRIVSGGWCAKCHFDQKRDSIERMETIARQMRLKWTNKRANIMIDDEGSFYKINCRNMTISQYQAMKKHIDKFQLNERGFNICIHRDRYRDKNSGFHYIQIIVNIYDALRVDIGKLEYALGYTYHIFKQYETKEL